MSNAVALAPAGPEDFVGGLRLAAPARADAGIAVEYVPDPDAGDAVHVTRGNDGSAVIRAARLNLALRGAGTLAANLVPPGQTRVETCSFDSLGVMIDCSRNAVMNVAHLKHWLNMLALLGFNQAMLYTEDTYEITGEPYFGYQRGRYSQAELREIDDHAAKLGIAVVGCIQTLAHLEQIFRWPGYDGLRDQGATMLVGHEPVYTLIGKMLDTMASCLSSRTIHLGMDEAWDMGRGRYLDQHGARDKFEIFSEHLRRVTQMAHERGLRPMIWSDMIFTTASTDGRWYEPKGSMRPGSAELLPRGVDLVYWDYYRTKSEDYAGVLRRHRELGTEPIMASGVWTWSQLWYNRHKTESAAGPCIDACRREGVRRLFFTMWGDDGAYCDFDSALAGLAWVAERAFTERVDDSALAQRFAAVCGGDYDAVVAASEMTEPFQTSAILWDDPILGIFANDGLPPGGVTWDQMLARFDTVAARLEGAPADHPAGDLRHARLIAQVLSAKVHLRRQLEAAYEQRDMNGLRAVRADCATVGALIRQLLDSLRSQWMRRNKPQGFEVLQIRLAGQVERHAELGRRLDDLISGRIDRLPELDERPKIAKGMAGSYRGLATAATHL